MRLSVILLLVVLVAGGCRSGIEFERERIRGDKVLRYPVKLKFGGCLILAESVHEFEVAAGLAKRVVMEREYTLNVCRNFNGEMVFCNAAADGSFGSPFSEVRFQEADIKSLENLKRILPGFEVPHVTERYVGEWELSCWLKYRFEKDNRVKFFEVTTGLNPVDQKLKVAIIREHSCYVKR